MAISNEIVLEWKISIDSPPSWLNLTQSCYLSVCVFVGCALTLEMGWGFYTSSRA